MLCAPVDRQPPPVSSQRPSSRSIRVTVHRMKGRSLTPSPPVLSHCDEGRYSRCVEPPTPFSSATRRSARTPAIRGATVVAFGCALQLIVSLLAHHAPPR